VALPLKAFREGHGEQGGEVNASTPIAEEIVGGVGGTIMGRNMFGGGPGPWGDKPWNGHWGDDPPFHHPVFVLTRHPREPLELHGATTFHFVTDGIESALEQAQAAAAGKDVSLGGGANVVRQYLAGRLLDEMLISLVPVLLGGGARLFDNLAEPRADAPTGGDGRGAGGDAHPVRTTREAGRGRQQGGTGCVALWQRST